mmetsp:Transcript_5019/g.13525  ORF Transcript_5019/g.13525 Transcript_5019/m.13525 type:complete len:104 (-) Transcript_5019:1771-2082(-)
MTLTRKPRRADLKYEGPTCAARFASRRHQPKPERETSWAPEEVTESARERGRRRQPVPNPRPRRRQRLRSDEYSDSYVRQGGTALALWAPDPVGRPTENSDGE